MKIWMLFVLVVVGIIVVNVWAGGYAVQYVLQFWGTYLQHKPVTVPIFPCMVAGCFLGEISIPAAICTWVLHFIL
ncbi:MAG: hypothetical protein ACLP3B_06445 [Syntrophobacteraceae bacterium]